MAQSVIGALRVNLGLDSAQFLKGAKQAQGSAQKLAARMAKVGAAVSAVGTGIALAVRGQLATFDDLAKTAQRIGVPVEALSQMRHAAELSGASLEGMQRGLRNVSRTMVNSADRFTDLGIAVRDTDGNMRPVIEVFEDAAQVISQMEDGADKTALAMQLFGERAGPELIPMLNQGRDGIRAMRDEADRLGLTVSTESAQAAERFNDNLTRIAGQMQGVVRIVTAELAPVLERISDVVVSVAERFQGMSPPMRRFVAVAAGITVVLGPVLLGLAALVASLGVILSPIGAVVFGIAALAGAAALAAANWDQLVERLPILKDAADYGRRVAAAWRDLPAIKWSLLIPVVRWASFIPGLRWLSFVRPIRWASVLPTIRWAALAGTLRWGSLITPLVWGARFIPVIGWAVTAGTLAWSLLIKPLGWDKFIPRINWRDWVPEINWSNLFGGSTAGSAARRVGADAAQGLADGIAAGQVAVERAAEAAAGAAETSSRARLQTRSPSRVFMQIGLDLMNGLGLGIQQGAQGPVERMREVAGTLEGPVQSALSNLQATAQSAFSGFVTGAMSAREAIAQVLQSLAKMWADAAFQRLFGGAFKPGGFLSFLVPSFATGVTNFQGGLARINEQGGEIVNLPNGANVIPHDLSKRMLDGASAGGLSGTLRVELGAGLKAEWLGDARGQAVQVVRAETPGMIREGIAQGREARAFE